MTQEEKWRKNYAEKRVNQWSEVAGLKKRDADGDYQTREMALVMDCEESIENLYQAYKKFVDGKKGIVLSLVV